ncbi:hypothetical protein [Echinicola sp. 20G]|nr:hypothetical protein [Echinicola sp. 20G]
MNWLGRPFYSISTGDVFSDEALSFKVNTKHGDVLVLMNLF